MLYLLICEDKAGSEALRKSTREAHLQYVGGFDVRFAGPMLTDNETHMAGSLIVLQAADRAAAQAFADGDPYALAGLFSHVTIRPFKQVVPA